MNLGGGHFIGVNTSVGIAQVKIDTARGLIEQGYYNPNPADKRLSPQNISKISRQELYPYLNYAGASPRGSDETTMDTLSRLRRDGYPSRRQAAVVSAERLKNPEHSIFFAAARMRALTNAWQKYVDISKSPEIITTLYHLPYKYPYAHPEPNDRGLQIANEFYKLAKEWLR